MTSRFTLLTFSDSSSSLDLPSDFRSALPVSKECIGSEADLFSLRRRHSSRSWGGSQEQAPPQGQEPVRAQELGPEQVLGREPGQERHRNPERPFGASRNCHASTVRWCRSSRRCHRWHASCRWLEPEQPSGSNDCEQSSDFIEIVHVGSSRIRCSGYCDTTRVSPAKRP